MSVPSATSTDDVYLWRQGTGGFGPSFPSRVTWERIRVPNPQLIGTRWFGLRTKFLGIPLSLGLLSLVDYQPEIV